MNENSTNNQHGAVWQQALEQITDNGGALFSSKALRKYFYARRSYPGCGKMHNEMADVYGQIVYIGAYHEKQNTLDSDGYLYSNTACIAKDLCLSESRVRAIANKLHEWDLIDKKTILGGTNIYKVIPEKFFKITTQYIY